MAQRNYTYAFNRASKIPDTGMLLGREWLVTNGLGGYASGTLSGLNTRRYHGLLIGALPSAHGRVVFVNRIEELVHCPDGTSAPLWNEQRTPADVSLFSAPYLSEFKLEWGIPSWKYEINGTVLEKILFMPYFQNTVIVLYRLLAATMPVRIDIRPFLRFRRHHDRVDVSGRSPYALTVIDDRYEIAANEFSSVLRVRIMGSNPLMILDGGSSKDVFYKEESDRGYDSFGNLWSPGYACLGLPLGAYAAFIASIEPWNTVLAMKPEEALAATYNRNRQLVAAAHLPAPSDDEAGQLVLAADQFIITPVSRFDEAVRSHAAGEELRSIIAGYHWFTDWGRDTMIGLEGLTLVTRRFEEAERILRMFAHHVRDGLIPNLFPEGAADALYHTADATLWFFHAVDRYCALSGNTEIIAFLLPTLIDIIECHEKETRFGIAVDPDDGLLMQGQPGYQLTWMDAKVGDWVVTPRRGKTVEINALWYNALRLTSAWVRQARGEAAARIYDQRADRAAESFNRRFWFEPGGYCYDVIDGESGDDFSCRPNQIFSISLPHAILDEKKWKPLLELIRERLLTPVGLRSLAPGSPEYKPQYFGDLRARDAAYHQGTVWAWLIGPFIDAWLKVHPGDMQNARTFLSGLIDHLHDACIGSISEVFDAEKPFAPRGCVAQAWSVAEVLRCWAKTSQNV
jgi:predicted glycogen debranching enzyme